MKAVATIAYGGPEVLAVIDRDVPVPGPCELRITVTACGVNPADGKWRQGMFADGFLSPFRTSCLSAKPSRRIDCSMPGVVEARSC